MLFKDRIPDVSRVTTQTDGRKRKIYVDASSDQRFLACYFDVNKIMHYVVNVFVPVLIFN